MSRIAPVAVGSLLRSGENIVHLWNDAGHLIRSLGEDHAPEVAVRALSFEPEGNYLAAVTNDGSIRLWNTDVGFIMMLLESHKGPVTGIEHSNDGRTMVSSSNDGSVRL